MCKNRVGAEPRNSLILRRTLYTLAPYQNHMVLTQGHLTLGPDGVKSLGPGAGNLFPDACTRQLSRHSQSGAAASTSGVAIERSACRGALSAASRTGLGLLIDRNGGISVLPEGEEILIRLARRFLSPGPIALRGKQENQKFSSITTLSDMFHCVYMRWRPSRDGKAWATHPLLLGTSVNTLNLPLRSDCKIPHSVNPAE